MQQKQNDTQKKIIAIRKTCRANGVGLSHYVLMDKETKSK
ncbi:MAG: modified peptide precursor CbpA [Verrucomicrobia bacterium]|nr:MAG: modified peptide precursor CbpA [Verrucomicrobiota bacterium]